MKVRLLRTLIMFASCQFYSAAGLAEPSIAPPSNSHETVMEGQAIQATLKQQFEKPGAPLHVEPISIVGQYAVVGWVQSDHGGRALLQKENGQWSVAVCGGDGLRSANNLVQAGLPLNAANALARKVTTAEAKLPRAYIAQLSMFGGMMKMNAPEGKEQSSTSSRQ